MSRSRRAQEVCYGDGGVCAKTRKRTKGGYFPLVRSRQSAANASAIARKSNA